MTNTSGVANAATSEGKLAHEIEENYQIQVNDKNFPDAHENAIKTENAVNGSIRNPKGDSMTSGQGKAMMKQSYSVSGVPVTVTVEKKVVNNGQQIKTTVSQH